MAEPVLSAHGTDETILIWGAGAIGGTLGACWARAGVPVLLVDREAAHVEACRTGGLAIEGPIAEFTQVVPATIPAELTGRYRRIVLAVKAQDTGGAMLRLKPHLSDDGFVVSAQNGLNELEIAGHVGASRTMGCFVNFGADWLGPGRILYGNRAALVVGEIDGSIRGRTREMHALMQLFEPDAVVTADIWAYLWGKLAYGAMLFATALTDESMSANFANPARVPVFIALGREVIAVAEARGVKPKGFGGFEPSAFSARAGDDKARAVIGWLADYTSQTAKTHSGIWRDLAVRKRRTEVDAQIAVIDRLGREAGIETPTIRALVGLVHDIEDGRRPMSPDAFAQLEPACV